MTTRRRYPPETRSTAVRQAQRDGVAVTSTALSIPRSTLRRWIAAARAAPAADVVRQGVEALPEVVALAVEPTSEMCLPMEPTAEDIRAGWDAARVALGNEHIVLCCDPESASVSDGCWRNTAHSRNELRGRAALLPSTDFAGQGAVRLEAGATLASNTRLPEPPFTMVVTAKVLAPASGRNVRSSPRPGDWNWLMAWEEDGESALFNGEQFVDDGPGDPLDASVFTIRVSADGAVRLRRNGRDVRRVRDVARTCGPGRIVVGGSVDCAVAELRIYDVALDPLELAAIERVTAARYGVAIASPSRWMDADWDVLAGKSLRELTLPGSHGAAAFAGEPAPDVSDAVRSWLSSHPSQEVAGPVRAHARAMATTQTLSLYEQLMLGIRYLDVPVTEVTPRLWVCNPDTYKPVVHLFPDITNFLEAHPREIVVIRLRFLNGDPVRAMSFFCAEMGALSYAVEAEVDLDALRLGELVGSGRRCLFLVGDTHVSSLHDASKTTNEAVQRLLQEKTPAPRRHNDGWYRLSDGGQTLRLGIERTLRLTDGDSVANVVAIGEIDATGASGGVEIEVGADTTTDGPLRWLPVGHDFDVVRFPSPELLRYGIGSTWKIRTASAGEDVPCTYAGFGLTGDPAPNRRKSVQLCVRNGTLLEAQCHRPVSNLDYALGLLRACGLPVLPILSDVLPPFAASLLDGAACTGFKDLLENARDARSVLREYVAWLIASRRAPQVLLCDHVGEMPVVDLAIRLSTGRPCDDLLATIQDTPPTWDLADLPRLEEALAMLLRATGYGCRQTGDYLREHLGIGADDVGYALHVAGYGRADAADFFRQAYGYSDEEVNPVLGPWGD